jgi:hypothetical protein
MERVSHPEITPLEFSDLGLNGARLRRRTADGCFSLSLRRVIEVLTADPDARSADHPAAEFLVGIEAVFLTGGRIENAVLRERSSRLFQPMIFGEESVFDGVEGGLEFLRARGLSGWVGDLGKSQLKLAAPERRWTFPRDWERLRPADDVPTVEIPTQRRRLREFIAFKLQIAMAEYGERPRALVFALPTKLAGDGTPHTSNYPGMRGDRTLLPDALAMAGLPDLPLFVLNDAELAAFSARADPRLAQYRKVLVLTLGFGLGAALICRSRQRASPRLCFNSSDPP